MWSHNNNIISKNDLMCECLSHYPINSQVCTIFCALVIKHLTMREREREREFLVSVGRSFAKSSI